MLIFSACYPISTAVDQLTLAISPRDNPDRVNALGNDVVYATLSATLGQILVVRIRISRIRMRRQFHAKSAVLLVRHIPNQLIELTLAFGSQHRFVQIVIDVF